MKSIYRIHPAIGTARVGNAEVTDASSFFIASDTPGIPNNFNLESGTFMPFKTPEGKVKKQAARFRIWRYEDDGKGRFVPVVEINLDSPEIAKIAWTVHLANRKASFIRFDGPKGESDNFKTRTDDLRNKSIESQKRAELLEIDEGPKSISGRNASDIRFNNSKKPVIPIDGLGELHTDEQGRLLVFGGKGQAASSDTTGKSIITDYVNNDTWFDDVSDGPVTATITFANGTILDADSAWVLVGPPDFAPATSNAVTLYDTIWDVAVRELVLPSNIGIYDEYSPGKGLKLLRDQNADWKANGTLKNYEPSFLKDILPIFKRSFDYMRVHEPAISKPFHYTFSSSYWASLADPAKGKGARDQLLGYIRDRDKTQLNLKQMPRGLGDNYQPDVDDFNKQFADSFVSIPRTHYALLRQWANGEFVGDFDATKTVIPAANPDPMPEELDRAALENCVGAPFFPGIETSWLIRNPAVYSEPFRIKLGAVLNTSAGDLLTVRAGFFTQQMAQPWQADFYDCHKEDFIDDDTGEKTYYMWWAAQRPDDVYRTKDATQMTPWAKPFRGTDDFTRFVYMLENWFRHGFVISEEGVFFEKERDPNFS